MTRIEIESFIVDSALAFLNKAKMSTVKDGNNGDLSQPIDSALRRLAIVPAVSGKPSDSDLALIDVTAIMYFKCLCMAETYAYLAGRLANIDQSMPAGGQKLSQYIDQAIMMAKYWEERATNFVTKSLDLTVTQDSISIGLMKYRTPGELRYEHGFLWGF